MTIELYDAWLVDTLEGQIEALETEKYSIINRQIELEEQNPHDIPRFWMVLEDRLTEVMHELEDLYKQVPPKDLRHLLNDQHCWHCDPSHDWEQIPF